MDESVSTFLAVTGESDPAVAIQYLDVTAGNLEYAVTLFMEAKQTHESNDEEMARNLQQQHYEQPQEEVRAADTSIHRHETLLDSFLPRRTAPTSDMIFGSGRVGVFNQRYDQDENEYHLERDFDDDNDFDNNNDDENDSDSDIMIIDSDEESNNNSHGDSRRNVGRRTAQRNSRLNELTSTQRRLAALFRPPFDIMDRIDIDSAKIKGRELKKWILVNIQDASEFRCQMLNRDFWSQSRIKSIVKDNFIFLQYQHDSVNGENYLNFYRAQEFPHIAILDPMTGERLKQWKDGEVPNADDWIDDVYKFLDLFSLDPKSKNPIVQHKQIFDPDSLSEEQQIEYAMRQSAMDAQGKTEDNPIELDEPETKLSSNLTNSDPFDAIIPQEHQDPSSGNITRVQIKFPNGKRLIQKYDLENDTVQSIFASIKYIISSNNEFDLTKNDRFNLSSISNKTGKPFIELKDVSIGEAGLKNATILLEKE